MVAPLSDALSDTEVKIGNGEGWKSGKRVSWADGPEDSEAGWVS